MRGAAPNENAKGIRRKDARVDDSGAFCIPCTVRVFAASRPCVFAFLPEPSHILARHPVMVASPSPLDPAFFLSQHPLRLCVQNDASRPRTIKKNRLPLAP
jgi:hypothetical protein